MTIDSWNERYRGRDLIWRAEPNQFLVSEVEDLAPGRALDLGCGEGRNAVWLATRGWEVTGVDFSDVGIAKARQMADERGVDVEWVVADLTTYDPGDGQFDLVILFYVHLPEPDLSEVLRRAVEAVAPGGALLIVAHDLSNLTSGYGGPQDPDLLQTPERISEHLAGLSVVKSTTVAREVETEEGSFSAIDSLVRAVRP